MEADPDRHWNHHSTGVPDRLCGQPMAGLECVELQQAAWQYTRPDLPAVLPSVAAGKPGRDRSGRLAAVLVVG